MDFGSSELAAIGVAILGGAAIGVERQRSGHASGPGARFGGLRTFTFLGALAGIAGLLARSGFLAAAAILLAVSASVVAIGYFRASARDVDATTEVAALVVLAAGVLAGLGNLQVSAGLTTFTVLLLAEKQWLHDVVERLDELTMLAAARFAVMSAVILPLLPEGPFGPEPGVRPRALWILVLMFSAISFVGFLAQRLAGRHGYALTGLLGGLLSSTSVTLTFARLSVPRPSDWNSLAAGAIAASTILFGRVILAVAVIHAALVPVLAKYLAAPFAVAVIGLVVIWRRQDHQEVATSAEKNPLEFRSAIEMALLFQFVLFGVFYVRRLVGDGGVMLSGFLLGLVDVDALTLSMTSSVSNGASLDLAASAIALGIVANSLMKAAIAITIGAPRFGRRTGAVLLAVAAAGAAALLFAN